mgnify:CR=1 FL=1
MNETILRIAVPSPLFRHFDYLPPASADVRALQQGIRVRVPFGRRKVVGILLEVRSESEIDRSRLKPALAILDAQPLISNDVLAMALWASAYYHHPDGETLSAALPTLLRSGGVLPELRPVGWRLTATGSDVDTTGL